MSCSKQLWKRVLFSTLFLFTSCSKECPKWESQISRSYCTEFNLAKISFPAENNFSGIELEFSRILTEVKGYLNVFSIDLKSCDQSILIRIKIDEEELDYSGIILKGGQRILLPQEATQKILEAFSQESSVEITVGQYHQLFATDNFSNAFGEIMTIPID